VADEHGQVRDEQLDAEREARRQIALAQIRQWPDPVLRLCANDVETFDDDLRRLAERMTRLMEDANGVGLAANQAGVLRRIFVFRVAEREDPLAAVNPRIAEPSEERAVDDEGCLSLQRVLVPVERSLSLVLEAQDLDGEPLRIELSGLDARVAQHEIDHLEGLLILDRTTPEARRGAMAVLRPQPIVL
jgi:peptide deformylase